MAGIGTPDFGQHTPSNSKPERNRERNAGMFSLVVFLIRMTFGLSMLAMRLASMAGVLIGKFLIWIVRTSGSSWRARRTQPDADKAAASPKPPLLVRKVETAYTPRPLRPRPRR